MPCRVEYLNACWWTGGRSQSAVVWKMIHLCLSGAYGAKEMQDVLRIPQGL
jgi:hypothetical protein